MDPVEQHTADQPMPPQPLLPARRPRAPSTTDPPAAEEAPVEVVLGVTAAEAPVRFTHAPCGDDTNSC